MIFFFFFYGKDKDYIKRSKSPYKMRTGIKARYPNAILQEPKEKTTRRSHHRINLVHH